MSVPTPVQLCKPVSWRTRRLWLWHRLCRCLHIIIFLAMTMVFILSYSSRDTISVHLGILVYLWIYVTVYLLKHHRKYWMKIFNGYLSGNLVCGDGNCGGRYHRTDDCCRKPWWLFSKSLLLIELSIVEDKHINQCVIAFLDCVV